MTGLCSGIYRFFILDSTLKSLIILLVLGTLLLLRRRASSAEHHSIWKFGLLSLLFLPLLSSLLPAESLPVLPTILASPYEQSRQVALVSATGSAGVRGEPESASSLRSPQPTSTQIEPSYSDKFSPPLPLRAVAGSYHDMSSLPTADPAPHAEWRRGVITTLCVLWMFVCNVLLFEMLIELIKLARLKKRATLMRTDSITVLAEGLAKELGMQRPFALYAAPDVMPMAWGWLYPVILLPTGTETWPVGRLRMVLLHELAHIRRNDWLTQRLARLVCALYWFNPLVWMALRAIRRESECACDDLVLSTGVGAPEYAQQLLEVIRMMKHLRPVSRATVAMAQSAHIQSRLRAILDPNRKRGGFGRHSLAITLVCLVCLAPLSITRVTAQQEPPITAPVQSDTSSAREEIAQESSAQHKAQPKPSGQSSDVSSLIAELQAQTSALEALSSELKRSAASSNLPPDIQRNVARQQEQVQSQLNTLRTLLKKLKSQQAGIAKQTAALQKSLQRLAQADQQHAKFSEEAALLAQQLKKQGQHGDAEVYDLNQLADQARLKAQEDRNNEVQQQILASEAQLAAAQAQLQSAEASFTRLQKLYQQGAVDMEEVDAARAQVEKSKADLLTIQVQIQYLRDQSKAEKTEKESSVRDLLRNKDEVLKNLLQIRMDQLKRYEALYAVGAATKQDVDSHLADLAEIKRELEKLEREQINNYFKEGNR